jgi:N,N'-diacetyllegionaminate synthase
MNRTIIIAEAGVNHNGNLLLAKKLIDAAVEAGVDYVKFQTFNANLLVSKSAQKAEYQKVSAQNEESQFDMLKKLELSWEDHLELIQYCKSNDIKFFSTAFDLASLDVLSKLGFQLFKIPSGEITNLPYLRKIAHLANEVILSTGMCTLEEIGEAIEVLKNGGIPLEKINVLHCNTEYPTPMKDVNLLAMNEIGRRFQVNVGYSDHTLGIEIPIAAVALGAKIIEKHFTLDRNMEGPDHQASLEPHELKAMVAAIRNIELALGSGLKTPSDSEKKNIAIARKSIHLKEAKKKGELLTEQDLEMLRPGDGISPMRMDELMGKICQRDLSAGHQLKIEDIA